ncbi:hypothetical protein HDU86_005560 [Geranomyces michiganensis]|nr:hypothetical protein HDU86_005560 [Geranomyces michiganensis]
MRLVHRQQTHVANRHVDRPHDMDTLLALGIQALSADCWKDGSPLWPVWSALMECGTEKAKALLRDPQNKFRSKSWDVMSLALGAVAYDEDMTAWRVLLDLELLDLDTCGEDLLDAAILGQNDICIQDLLEKEVTSDHAIAKIFAPAFGYGRPGRKPNMALFKRIVNDPAFYTAQSWAEAASVLVELPFESADRREALRLLVSRPLLAVPTGKLIMGLIDLNEAEPGNSASALLPQIIETAGNDKIREAVHSYWANNDNRREEFHLWFARLTKNTLILHKYGIPDLIPATPFVELGAHFAEKHTPSPFNKSLVAADVDWIARGLFHDVDERGHSDFTEAVLESMEHQYQSWAADRLNDWILKLFTERPIRIKDCEAFLKMLVVRNHWPHDGLSKLLHDDVDLRMMSQTGEYDVRLSAPHLVAAAIIFHADLSLIYLIFKLGPTELYYQWKKPESTKVEECRDFLVGGLVWIAEALELLAVHPLYATKRSAVKQNTLIDHISKYLKEFTECWRAHALKHLPERERYCMPPHAFKDIPVAERPSVLPIAVGARKCNWLEVGEFCEKLEFDGR